MIDPSTATVTVALHGFWGLGNLSGLSRDLDREVPRLRCAPGAHRVLVDLTGFEVQEQEVAAALIGRVAEDANRPRRLALVAARGLVRMQARRAAVREDVAVFADAASACAWLLS